MIGLIVPANQVSFLGTETQEAVFDKNIVGVVELELVVGFDGAGMGGPPEAGVPFGGVEDGVFEFVLENECPGIGLTNGSWGGIGLGMN